MFDNVRRVFGHSVVYGSADIAIQAVNFLLIPIYTRVLSPGEYGALAILLVFEAFLKPLQRAGLGDSFVRFFYDYPDEENRRTLAGTIVVSLLGVNAVLLLVLLLAAPQLAVTVLGTADYTLALSLLAINGAMAAFFVVPFSLLRIQERATRLASLTFARSLGTVLARLVLVVGLRLGVVGIMLADVVVTVVLLVALSGVMRSATAWRVSKVMAAGTFRFGVPQVLFAFLHQTMAMSDRFFLAIYLPIEQVGVYLIGSTIASLIKLYPVAFKTAWMPFAFDRMDREGAPELFAKMATYAFGVLAFSTLGLAALAEGFVTLMTPTSFHRAIEVVPILVLGMAVQTTTNFIATSVEVAKRTHLYPASTVVAAALTVTGHVVLIPRFGLVGAALAVGSGQVVQAASLGYFAQRVYHIPYEWARLWKLVGVGLLLYVVIITTSGGSGLGVLAVRVLLVTTFPLGLLAVRFFRPSELADIRRLAEMLGARGRPAE
jgi:O-antigen/teichoic acid export membrane protein